MKLYLAGGMKDGWQDKVSKIMPAHELLDPRSWSDPDPLIYTERDLNAIRSSDLVLVYIASNNPSGFGLSVELGYAFALKKPIIFVDAIKNDWRSRYFDMHRQLSVVVDTLDAAAKIVNK